MAMSNAERQAAYRTRQIEEGDLARLNTLLTAHAKAALGRLARRYGVTERATLERLLVAAERRAVAGLKGAALRRYYD